MLKHLLTGAGLHLQVTMFQSGPLKIMISIFSYKMKTLKSKLALLGLAVACSCILIASISTTPDPRLISYPWMSLERWYNMHAEDVGIAEKGEASIVFWGDSITEGWNGNGRELWDRHFASRGAVNFGIGGDMTQNLLWRLDHGSVGNLDPEKVVLLIGTNNFGFTGETPAQVAEGVFAVTTKLLEAYPGADILLMAVFPRSKEPDHPNREKITTLNNLIRPLGGLDRITCIDIGDRFLLPDGTLSAELMPDFLHLSAQGYKIWAEAVLHWLDSGHQR